MKVCVFGAGAVGGHVAARLVAAGKDEISIVARGHILHAVREKGYVLRSGGEELRAHPKVVTDDPSTLPPQDVILVTMKAHALSAGAAQVGHLLAPNGVAIFLINGIPWWWNYGHRAGGGTLALLDPKGVLWHKVKPERTIGCVVHSPNDMVEPGVIVHTGPNHLVLGEPDGSNSERLQTVVAMLERGGITVKVSGDIRRDVWQKLVLNASGNTLAALSRTDLGGLGTDPGLCDLSERIMREGLAVAAATGWDLTAETDVPALARRGKPGQRPSMLQDVLQKRPMEVEALLGQIQAFAQEHRIATPTIDVILPLLRGVDRWIRAS